MHGAAPYFARKVIDEFVDVELFMVSDMCDLSVFRALTQNSFPKAKYICYFHENQLGFPWEDHDPELKSGNDSHYAFINIMSAYSADRVLFNSGYQQKQFLADAREFLKKMPRPGLQIVVDEIHQKSQVIPIGIDTLVTQRDYTEKIHGSLLWNHRWEADKNPEGFIHLIAELKKKQMDFSLILLGDMPVNYQDRIKALDIPVLQMGYVKSRANYFCWLQKADIIPITSYHDFQGLSLLEAMAVGTIPVVPNRMVYPDHIPEEYRNKLIYHSEDQLLEKTSLLLNMKDKQAVRMAVSEKGNSYAWEKVMPMYEACYDGLML